MATQGINKIFWKNIFSSITVAIAGTGFILKKQTNEGFLEQYHIFASEKDCIYKNYWLQRK